MEYLTKNDLRKLAKLCEDRRFADELVRDNGVDGVLYSHLERSLAAHEADWLKGLATKLDRIADSQARRIEVTF